MWEWSIENWSMEYDHQTMVNEEQNEKIDDLSLFQT